MFRIKLNIQNSVFLQLFIIAALIIGNYSAVVVYDSNLSEIEKTVDLVESNGTYSQQITLFATLLKDGKEEYRLRLAEAISKFHTNLAVLKNGGESPENRAMVAPVPAELLSGYFQPLEIFWNKYKENADIVIDKKLFIDGKILNPEIKEAYDFILKNNQKLLERNSKLVNAYLRFFDGEQASRDNVLLVIFIINIGLIGLMVIYIIYNVSRPISKLNEIDNIINEGNFERRIDYRRDDELGKVATSINRLFQNLRSATDFILAIGEGRLDSDYQGLTDKDNKDRLGTALLEMRDKMSNVAESDRQRNWTSEGLAKFADIFRTYSTSEDFTYIIISNLVKYVEANQGGLFIVEDEREEDPYLELVAAYAFEKRKYVHKRITKGEGLVGEVFQEGGLIYMTDVPDNYVHITSGLGDATPRSVLLVPLKLNDEIYGVVELASFDVFEDYKIEFIQRLSESIASTFASVKNNQRTERLLQESIQLSEQMRSQEEEMRQNLEELVSTQEEAQRRSQLTESQKVEIEKTLQSEQNRIQELELQQETYKKKIEELRSIQRELESENRQLKEQVTEQEKSL